MADEKATESCRRADDMDSVRSASRVGPLRRGLSMANQELVANVRQHIESCERFTNIDRPQLDFFEETPTFSFILPNITNFKDKALIEFLKKDLIDKNTYTSLSKAGVLNWWADQGLCRKLFPMSTVGDGNCLLHAVSLAMWGFNDRLLTLRKALHRALTSFSAGGSLKRRWMYQQWTLNVEAGGLCFTEDEWENEWQEIVRLASDKPRTHNTTPSRKISIQYSKATSPTRADSVKTSEASSSFESLEEFHVFVLAQILRRPIIVVADTMLRDNEGEPLQPINFGGIYLPVECDRENCYKYPLILGYDSAHFAALVPAEGEDIGSNKQKLASGIPLVCQNRKPLPVQFLTDPGPLWMKTQPDSEKKRLYCPSDSAKLELLSTYLEVTHLSSSRTADGQFSATDKKEDKSTVTKALSSISNLMYGHASHVKQRIQKNSSNDVYAARIDLHNKPKYYEDMIQNYIEDAKRKLHITVGSAKTKPSQVKCITPGCKFYGAEITHFLCSGCYRTQLNLSDSKTHKSMPSLSEESHQPLVKSHTWNAEHSNNQIVSTLAYQQPSQQRDLISFHSIPSTDIGIPATSPLSEKLFNTHLHEAEVWPLGPGERILPTAPYPSLDGSPYTP